MEREKSASKDRGLGAGRAPCPGASLRQIEAPLVLNGAPPLTRKVATVRGGAKLKGTASADESTWVTEPDEPQPIKRTLGHDKVLNLSEELQAVGVEPHEAGSIVLIRDSRVSAIGNDLSDVSSSLESSTGESAPKPLVSESRKSRRGKNIPSR